MSSPFTQQFKQVESRLTNAKNKLEEKFLQLKEAGDEQGMRQIGANLRSIQGEYARIAQNYQQEQTVRKENLLSGIASGSGIGYEDRDVAQQPASGSGMYNPLYAPTTRKEGFPTKETPKLLKKQIAELVEADPKKVDVTTGVGLKETTVLAGLKDDESRKAYLQKKYKEVLPLSTPGTSNFLVKDKNGKITLAFPLGVDMKDVVAAGATETLPLAAGIGVGIKTLATGPLAPFIASGASNLAYSGVGAAQDVAFRKMAGLPAEVGNVASERGKEAVVGGLIDLATFSVAKPFTKRIGSTIENNVAKELREATELLQKKGMDVTYPVGAEGGTLGLTFQRELAGKFPKMAVAKTMEKTRGVMAEYQKAIQDKVIGVPKVDITNRIKSEADQLAAQIGKQNVRLEQQAKGWVDNKLRQIMPDNINQVESGKQISQILTKGQEATRNTKNAAFDNFANTVNQAGIVQTPEELASVLRPIVQNSDLGRNPGVEQIMIRLGNARADQKAAKELEDEIAKADAAGFFVPEQNRIRLKDLKEYSEPFDAVRSRNLIQNLQNQVEKDPFGNSKTDNVVLEATRAVRGNFEDKLKSVGLTGEWDKFKEAYTDYAAYQKGQIGKMITDNFGDISIAPEKILDKALSDTKSINDIFNAVRASGDIQGETFLRDTLKKSYLEKIGITSGYKGTNSKYKPEMVEALWGNNLASKRINSTIEELNNALKANKVDIVNIPAEDVNRLLDIIPVNERQKLVEDIVKKGKIQAREDRLMSNEVVKQAKRGNWTYLDNDIFADTMLNKASTSDVLEITKRLPTLSEKQKVGADMFARLLSDYSTAGTGANQGRFGFDLWDAEKVVKDLKGWTREKGTGAPQWVKNMDAVVGKDTVDEFIAASRVQAANRPIGKVESLEARGLTSATGIKVYASPFQYIGNKMLAAAYGSNNLRPFLRGLSKDIGDEAYQKNATRMLKGIIGTRTGLQAAAIQGRNDPDFQEQMQIILSEAQAQAEEQK
jgi:polyhydroxyalkanoate synthesis regulator phasin